MIPQFPQFKKLEFSDRKEILALTEDFPPYSDFNFVSMFSWNTEDTFEISVLGTLLIVKFNDYITNQPFLSFHGKDVTEEHIHLLFEYSKKNNLREEIKLVPAELANILFKSNSLTISEDVDNFDYVYSTILLTDMKGGLFETKRNLINRFHKFTPNPSYKILDLTDNFFEEKILELFTAWHAHKLTQDEKFEAEHEFNAVKRILLHCEKLSLKILCLFSAESLIGFSIFEILIKKKAICHFAKINLHFTGAQDYIMQQQAKWLLSEGIQVLNYEQDLGIKTLRHSKQSFRPTAFLKKYRISTTSNMGIE